jgi:hypothetical protein
MMDDTAVCRQPASYQLTGPAGPRLQT